MKKVLSILLVCLMVFSMTACNSDSGWKTKNVKAPEVTLEWQEVSQINAATNFELKDNIIVSPLKVDKYNPKTALEAIKKLDFTKNWVSEERYSEQGVPYFTDDNQVTAFRHGTRMSIHEDSDTGKGFIVYYSADTDVATDYATVAIEFLPNEKKENLTQKQILEVLKIVFGNEYAEFLCYAKMTQEDEYARHTITNGDASMLFERAIYEDNYITFSVNVSNTNKQPVNGYGADFTPTTELLTVLADILRWNAGDTVLDLNTMGTSFLTKHFGEGAKFAVESNEYMNSSAYIYGVDGEYKTMMMQYKIAQEGVKPEKQLNASLSVSQSGETVETYCMFELGNMGTAAMDEDRNAMKAKAEAIVEDIMMREVEAPFVEDNHFELTLNSGTKVLAIFRLAFEKDEAGNEYAILSFATTTDLTYFDK